MIRDGVPRVALVTCAEVPGVDSDSRLVILPLSARGVEAIPVVWDRAGVDWASFDLAVIRSCWDYVPRRPEFLAWAAGVPRLANPADVLVWNTDKRYLEELAAGGLPVVPTEWRKPGDRWDPPDEGEIVVKPVVSMASLDTGRYRMSDSLERSLAHAHVRRLLDSGRDVMVQPYVAAVDDAGETSLVYFGGRLSHAIRKAPSLSGPDTGLDRRFVKDGGVALELRAATDGQRAVAEKALAAVPGGPARLLYARVDLVPGTTGEPLLIEIELTEPQLFLAAAPGSAERLADAIARRL